MAKKIKNSKLSKPFLTKNSLQQPHSSITPQPPRSTFSNFAQKIQKSKQKKIQKLNEIKTRLMNKNKSNKFIKIPSSLNKNNKINKFALLDDQHNQYQPTNQLTHKGTSIQKIKHFNDMYYDNDELDNDQINFNDLHEQINFHGFDNNQNSNQNQIKKTKNQIYQQIIQKSKLHKRNRQEQYQHNFNAAVQLDQEFPQFVSKLKLRGNDRKIRSLIENTKNSQYEKLINQLKVDERVIANKVVQNKKKGVEKVKKKKNQQLNQLMKNSDGEEEDIRGWVKGLDSEQSAEEQEIQDQIDEVNLSSSDEGEDDEELELQGYITNSMQESNSENDQIPNQSYGSDQSEQSGNQQLNNNENGQQQDEQQQEEQEYNRKSYDKVKQIQTNKNQNKNSKISVKNNNNNIANKNPLKK